jgi:DNA-binding NarL/FixJ family response regulator
MLHVDTHAGAEVTVLILESDALLRSFLIDLLGRAEGIHVLGCVAGHERGHREAVAGAARNAIAERRPRLVLVDLDSALSVERSVLSLERDDELAGLNAQCLTLNADPVRHLAPSDIPFVLALCGEETEEAEWAAVQSGARGFLPKSQAADILLQAVQTVARGELWLTPQVTARLFSEYQRLARREGVGGWGLGVGVGTDRTDQSDQTDRTDGSAPNTQHPTPSTQHPPALSEREREVLSRIARGMTNHQIARDLFLSVHTVKLHIQKILRKLNLPNRTEAAVFAVREGLLA